MSTSRAFASRGRRPSGPRPKRRVLRPLLWASCAAACLACWGAGPPSPAEPPKPTGLELMAQGRFEEALPALEAALVQHPGDMALGVARAKCLLELARWQQALAAATDLEKRFPDKPDPRILTGDCLFCAFRPAAAAEEYRPLLGDPRCGPAVLVKYASALLALGRDQDALAAVGEARAAGAPLQPGALGLAFTTVTDPRQRLGWLEQLLQLRPEDPALLGELGLAKALAARPAFLNRPPAAYPAAAPLKEMGREPVVQVVLEGKRKWLTFDTGGEGLLLNEDTARKLGLPLLGQAGYGGWGYHGVQKTDFVFVGTLVAAGRTLENLRAAVNRRDTEFWTNKAGYLGIWPFRGDVLHYDRRNGVFALWPRGTEASSLLKAAGARLPILWGRGLPLVPVMVQGRGPYPFLLDTGAPYTLLAAQRIPPLGIRVNSGKYGNIHGLGVSGAFSSGVAESVDLDFAGVHYHRPVAFVTEIPQPFPVPVFGVLGRDILNDFKMVFDGPGNTVTLVPYDAPSAIGRK